MEIAGGVNMNLRLKIIEKFGTQSDFAQAIGEFESDVSRVIRGRRKLSAEKKNAWAKYLDTNVENIFSE